MHIQYSQYDIVGSGEVTHETMADLIRVDTGVGDGEVQLPDASEVLGRRYTVRKVGGSGSLSVYPSGMDTINGSDSEMVMSSGDPPVTLQAVRTGEESFGWESV